MLSNNSLYGISSVCCLASSTVKCKSAIYLVKELFWVGNLRTDIANRQ